MILNQNKITDRKISTVQLGGGIYIYIYIYIYIP